MKNLAQGMATVVIKIMKRSLPDPTKLSRQSWTQVLAAAVAKGVPAIGVEEVAVAGVEEVGKSSYNKNILWLDGIGLDTEHHNGAKKV